MAFYFTTLLHNTNIKILIVFDTTLYYIMVMGDSCETNYEKRLRLKQKEELNKPLRPITTEAEEQAKENQEIQMKMQVQSDIQIEEIKRKEIKMIPKPDEIAEDNPQKRELEKFLKEQEEKETKKYCWSCGVKL